jgi:Na+/proline symporter
MFSSKTHPNASEKRLVFVGRVATGVIVVISILWVPLIKYLSNEIYQYLQSVQAYIGAPITATFLVGVLWKRATARAAFTTLVTGGLLGAGRFILDVMHDAFQVDLGVLERAGEVQLPELQRDRVSVLRAADVRDQR